MQLPGGLWKDGTSRKDFAFRPLTGSLELALADVVADATSLPAAVTAALVQALAQVGGQDPAPDCLRALCVSDRQYLLRQLQIHLGLGERWHQAPCGACREPFDFPLDLAALPVVPAARGYPFAALSLAGQRLRFRLPTGADQEAIAGGDEDEREVAWAMVRRCWVNGTGRPGQRRWRQIVALGLPALDAIETAMEAVAPAIASEVEAACPQCGAGNLVAVDSSDVLRLDADGLLREVHALAVSYHWSEAAILALRPPRRHHYLRLIDEARGMVQ